MFILGKDLHSKNAYAPKLFRFSGRVIFFRFLFSLKAPPPIVTKVLGRDTVSKLVASSKALISISSTPSFKTTSLSPLPLKNKSVGIFFTLPGIIIFSRLFVYSNAPSPISSKPSGRLILFRLSQSENVFFSIYYSHSQVIWSCLLHE